MYIPFKKMYPTFAEWCEYDQKWMLLYPLAIAPFFFIGFNLFFATLYYIEHPAIEALKITDGPWPWKSNPKKFWYKLW